MKEVTMTDHQFAAWLRKRGWVGSTHQTHHGTQFLSSAGSVLALAVYDNAACTRKIFIKEDPQ